MFTRKRRISESIASDPLATLALYFITDCTGEIAGLHSAMTDRLAELAASDFAEKPSRDLYRARADLPFTQELVNGFASSSHLLECAVKFGHDNIEPSFEVWRLNLDAVSCVIRPQTFFTPSTIEHISNFWPAIFQELKAVKDRSRFELESESLAIFQKDATVADLFSSCVCRK